MRPKLLIIEFHRLASKSEEICNVVIVNLFTYVTRMISEEFVIKCTCTELEFEYLEIMIFLKARLVWP